MSTNLEEFQAEKRKATWKARRPYIFGCLLPLLGIASCIFAPQLWHRGPFLWQAADQLELGMTEAKADEVLSAFPFIVEKHEKPEGDVWSVWKVPEGEREFGTPYLLIEFDVEKKVKEIKTLDI